MILDQQSKDWNTVKYLWQKYICNSSCLLHSFAISIKNNLKKPYKTDLTEISSHVNFLKNIGLIYKMAQMWNKKVLTLSKCFLLRAFFFWSQLSTGYNLQMEALYHSTMGATFAIIIDPKPESIPHMPFNLPLWNWWNFKL